MMIKKIALLLLIFFISFSGYAQNKVDFTLTLKDGSIVTGSTKITNITLSTAYGNLEIPIKNVTTIELGIHADNSQKSKVINLVKQLSNSNTDMRASAYKSITKLSASAISVIEEVMFSSEYSPGEFSDYSLSTAINELKAIHNIADNYRSKDVVYIDYEYNMGGKYAFKTIELKTEYGTLIIPREKIEKIDVMYYDAADGDMKTFKLFATTHISGNNNGGWLKTGIMVKQGQGIDILAAGEVTFASLSGNKYKPDGSFKGSGSDKFTPNASNSIYPVYGNAVFKIGKSGKAISAGDKYNNKADATGMIYLSIYETVYNASNTGYYIVKLKVR